MDRGGALAMLLEFDLAAGDAAAPSRAVARAVSGMAEAAAALAAVISAPAPRGRMGAYTGGANADGDGQRHLDLVAEELFAGALRRAGVAGYLSEEVEAPCVLDPEGALAVAIDPLDGSSNIDVNAPVGTIFSIFAMVPEGLVEPAAAFRRSGRGQLAAGFFIYGPRTALMVSFGRGVHLLVLDARTRTFVVVESGITIPSAAPEYAINASNYRHWRPPVRRYIDDCVLGEEAPGGRNHNMRWVASLVADSYRIFMRGGIFLYPGDARSGYENGRLRLMYEANPIAFLAEQAGGAATDGVDPILDRLPQAPHERSPLVMGSAEMVERVRRYHLDRAVPAHDRPPATRRDSMFG